MTTTEKLDTLKALLKVVREEGERGEVTRSVITDLEMKIRLLEEGIVEGKKMMLKEVKEKGDTGYGDICLSAEEREELEARIEKE